MKRPRVVVIAAMGGSAAARRSGRGLRRRSRRDPRASCIAATACPRRLGRRASCSRSSYSGNSAEVLSAAETALDARAALVVVAAGGDLGDARGAARVFRGTRMPDGLMPRMALGYLFFPMTRVLRGTGHRCRRRRRRRRGASPSSTRSARELAPDRPLASNEAKRAGARHRRADGRPIYGGPVTGGVAYRWKTDIEENAKSFALAGALPEMNHNTIEAWRAPLAARAAARAPAATAGSAARSAGASRSCDELAGRRRRRRVRRAGRRGEGVLARLLSLTYLGQWVELLPGVLRGVDPWTVPAARRDQAPAARRAEPALGTLRRLCSSVVITVYAGLLLRSPAYGGRWNGA